MGRLEQSADFVGSGALPTRGGLWSRGRRGASRGARLLLNWGSLAPWWALGLGRLGAPLRRTR